jgi:hypothetical protein
MLEVRSQRTFIDSDERSGSSLLSCDCIFNGGINDLYIKWYASFILFIRFRRINIRASAIAPDLNTAMSWAVHQRSRRLILFSIYSSIVGIIRVQDNSSSLKRTDFLFWIVLELSLSSELSQLVEAWSLISEDISVGARWLDFVYNYEKTNLF